MALDTYDNLKLELADWIDRDDLATQIDTFIDIAEARHKREIRARSMLVHDAAFAIAINLRSVAYPPDFNDIKHMRLLIPDAGQAGRRYYPDFDYVTTTEMSDRSRNDLRRPCVYTAHTAIEFDSETDRAYTAELFYYKKLTALSGADQTNALLTDAPDAYLYGALAATAPFLLNDERVQVWEGLYTNVRDTLNAHEIASTRSGPLVDKLQNIPRALRH